MEQEDQNNNPFSTKNMQRFKPPIEFFMDTGTDVTPDSVLEEASRVIDGPRADDYGDVFTSFSQIADYWTTYVRRTMESIPDDSPFELTPTDVANMMILLKVSRAQKKGDRDSYVDIAGYVGCVEKLGGIS